MKKELIKDIKNCQHENCYSYYGNQQFESLCQGCYEKSLEIYEMENK